MIHWTDLGKELLLLNLIDPQIRHYTLIANKPKYTQRVNTDDPVRMLQHVIEVNQSVTTKKVVKLYAANTRRLLAYIDFNGAITNEDRVD